MSSRMSKNFLRNKKVLITGAAGSIGSALARVVAGLRPKGLMLLDQDETGIFDLYEEIKAPFVEFAIGSVRDSERMREVFGDFRPDIVYHAAAYKHVKLMDLFPEEARKTNVVGLLNVMAAALDYEVKKFVFISSDKAVEAKSVMGQTKWEGEELCRASDSLKTAFIVVRFGNVMASRGSVVPIFQKQISENKPVTVTDKKMKRYFMGIYDAVRLILRATELGKHGDVFVLDMGEEMSIDYLAKLMIKLSGKDLPIVYTHAEKGEKHNEKLMTDEEKGRAVKKDGLYIIGKR